MGCVEQLNNLPSAAKCRNVGVRGSGDGMAVQLRHILSALSTATPAQRAQAFGDGNDGYLHDGLEFREHGPRETLRDLCVREGQCWESILNGRGVVQ